jgi:hypothetical protein
MATSPSSGLSECKIAVASPLRAAEHEKPSAASTSLRESTKPRRAPSSRRKQPLSTVGTSLARSHAMALTLAMLAFGLFCFVLVDQLVRRS